MLPNFVHPSWQGFLSAERRQQVAQITKKIGDGYLPPPPQALRFLETDLNSMRVVILGQDPYPQAGASTGRAFEVATLQSWQEPFPQSSLRNILRLLYASQQNIADYQEIPKFQALRRKIEENEWKILPPHRLFAAWETQGVLLLNTSFTVKDTPGEHARLWLGFTEDLLRYISTGRRELHWFLWGKKAQSFMPFMGEGLLHLSRHPMLTSPAYEDDFLRSTCFKATWQLIDWLGTRKNSSTCE